MSEQRAPYIITVKKAPNLANPIIQRGFNSLEKVKEWAAKNGHGDVYWWAAKETVYVERRVSHVQTA